MNNLLFREDIYPVRSYDADYTGKARIVSLVRFAQESAWKHATDLGFGFEKLKQENMAWILRSFVIDMNKIPFWGDEIIIRTWPCGFDRVRCYRDFIFFNKDREILGKASSTWFVIDIENRLPKKTKSYYHLFKTLTEKPQLEELLNIKLEKQVSGKTNSRKVYLSDLDVNYHVNNTNYIQWVFDEYCLESFEQKTFKNMTCHFYSEALHNDIVLVNTNEMKKNCFFHSIQRENEEKNLVEIIIQWEE